MTNRWIVSSKCPACGGENDLKWLYMFSKCQHCSHLGETNKFLNYKGDKTLDGLDAAKDNTKKDNVNNVAHYGGDFVMKFINFFKLNFAKGNAVKYIARAGEKDPTKLIEDLEKAQWYLNWEINRLKEEKNNGR